MAEPFQWRGVRPVARLCRPAELQRRPVPGRGPALRVTGIYTVGFVVFTMGFGLAIALLLDVKLPGVRHLRAPFIIPLVVPSVATALIWGNLFAPDFGIVNRALSALGLPQGDFTSSPSLAFLTVLTFGIWQFFGECVIFTWPLSRRSPWTSWKRRASTAPARGGASGTSAGPCCAAPSSSASSPPSPACRR